MKFPAARKGDPVTHGGISPCGTIGPPAGECGYGPVFIEGLRAAHVGCLAICDGTLGPGVIHPPTPATPIIVGSETVKIHALPAARWLPSGDLTACGAFLGLSPLAGARTVFIGGPATNLDPESVRLAMSLIKIGGSADESDRLLVLKQLARLPPHVLQRLLDKGSKVVVCRDAVTEYDQDLKGEQPRGWKKGDTWDKVPGEYDPARNEVVIAVQGHGTPEGPNLKKGHGSDNLVLHEVGHAIDSTDDPKLSCGKDFGDARAKDLNTYDAYERQKGDAGKEETYAESFANYYNDPDKNAKQHPNLNEYWKKDPLKPKP
jgi:uncharacterized Zn-binding protein involved in type VI secretion